VAWGGSVGLSVGQQAMVRVAVATLWAGPEAIRPVDEPALGRVPDIRAWIAGLAPEQMAGDCVLSQLLLGERVLVEEICGEWSRVVAIEQPAGKLDPRGYPGWLPTDQLAPPYTVDTFGRYVVDATVTALRDAPGGDVVLRGVVLGTRLPVAGPAYQGWLPVGVAGHQEPLWALGRDLVATRAMPPPSAEQVLAVATRLLDVAYLWGGVSAYGIDCSGLVHLAWRRFGVTLPRDADDQAAATTPLEWGEERPGDLYFFAHAGQKVHHIGFVAARPHGRANRRMLHACYAQRRVVDEPIQGDRAATLFAAHRVQT
jgi:cell wall-associated NlpC family hydrolase